MWAGALFPVAGKTKNLTGSKTKTKETWKHLTALIHHSPRFFSPLMFPLYLFVKVEINFEGNFLERMEGRWEGQIRQRWQEEKKI